MLFSPANDRMKEMIQENYNRIRAEVRHDRMKEMIQENYNRIRAEVRQIVADELQRIQSDPELQHLLQNK